MGHPILEAPLKSKEKDLPVFIHYQIDEMDLSLEAFRVYFHLARRYGDGRVGAISSYKNMGEHCFRQSYPCASQATLKRKAITAVNQLLEKGLIEKTCHKASDGSSMQNSYRIVGKEELRGNKVIPFPESRTSSASISEPCSGNASDGTIAPPLKNTTAKDSTAKTHSEREREREKSKKTKSRKANKKNEDNMNSEDNQPQSISSLTTNESEKTKSSEDVEETSNIDPYWTGHNEKVIDIQRKRAFRDSIGNAPFQSVEEMNQFQQDLIEFARLTGKRSPGGFAQSILKEMRESGFEHPYWLEWKHGEVIGTHEKQEWESLPGQPYPYFLEFLKEELKAQKHSDTQALQQANWIVSNPAHCKPHWEKFKLRVEREAEDKAKQLERGVEGYVAPTWARSRFVSVEDAAKSMAQLESQGEPQEQKKLTDSPQDSKSPADNQHQDIKREEGWEDPVGIVEQWLDDIETKWSRPFRGLAQRCFADAIAHATPDEEATIYKRLLDCPLTHEWAKQSVNEKSTDFDF